MLDIGHTLVFEQSLGAGAIAAELPCIDGDGYHISPDRCRVFLSYRPGEGPCKGQNRYVGRTRLAQCRACRSDRRPGRIDVVDEHDALAEMSFSPLARWQKRPDILLPGPGAEADLLAVRLTRISVAARNGLSESLPYAGQAPPPG